MLWINRSSSSKKRVEYSPIMAARITKSRRRFNHAKPISIPLLFTSCLFGFAEKGFLKLLPQDAEEQSLQSIGQYLGLESTEEESTKPTFLDNLLYNLRVANLLWIRLLVDLDDANRVGTRVRHCRRAKSQNGTTSQLRHLGILFRNHFRQRIVREEPRIVTDKGGTGGRQRAIPQRHGSGEANLVDDSREFTSHLPVIRKRTQTARISDDMSLKDDEIRRDFYGRGALYIEQP